MTLSCRHLIALLLTMLGVAIQVERGGGQTAAEEPAAAHPVYRSPLALALSPEGKTLYVTDRTAGNVTVLDAASGAKQGEIKLQGEPAKLALSADGGTLYAAQRKAGAVAVIDTKTRKVTGQILAGRWPRAVALAEKARRLYVANQDANDVSVVDLAQSPPKTIARVAVLREPSDLALSPDERWLVVANQLPHGVSSDPTLAAKVSIIDCQRLAVASQVGLPPGSTDVNGVCVSPDGKWAYAIHHLGRFNLPITQLERGWVSTFAVSLIDLAAGKRVASLLLDDLSQGAPDPYAVACTRDGQYLWISHAGVHEVSRVHIGLVHEILAGRVPPELALMKDGQRENIWVRIQKDRSQLAELENDLTALYIAGAIRRFPSGGKAPRGLLLTPDEKKLLVANYFTGAVAVLSANDGKLLGEISLGPSPKPDATRRGEMVFSDANHAFQRWYSCATCHPNDGRVDGLRWDFMRDGIGNPKETPSLIMSAKTPPMNWLATRKDIAVCAQTGLLNGHMIVPAPETVEDLLAYLVSLEPEPSPFLAQDGKLTAAAQRGKTLFEGRASCAECHPGPLFTDQLRHDVGVHTSNDPSTRYDTPSLVEVRRTAPYLHDGRAMTLQDVLTSQNESGRHGNAKALSPAEIEDLVQYLLSL